MGGVGEGGGGGRCGECWEYESFGEGWVLEGGSFEEVFGFERGGQRCGYVQSCACRSPAGLDLRLTNSDVIGLIADRLSVVSPNCR